VVLYADNLNGIYYQATTSRIYKLFPDLLQIKKYEKYRPRSKGQKVTRLDVDFSTILNHQKYQKKYSIFRKDTFISVEKIVRDNLFDFENKIYSSDYIYKGSLFQNNQNNILTASKESIGLSSVEMDRISSFATNK